MEARIEPTARAWGKGASRALSRFTGYARTLDCVHCGLCLPTCPTYGVTLNEADSPRGRVYLLRGFAEERLELTPLAEEHLRRCIVCRACETSCPSGIRMGEMMEAFRSELARRTPWRLRDALARFLLRHVIPRRDRIAALTDLLYVYQQTGPGRLARAVARRLSRRLAGLDDLLPPIPHPSVRHIETDGSRPVEYPSSGKARLRVGLFLGCIASEWFAGTHHATVRVLTRNGIDVIVPEDQTCCGALHRHAGLLDDATKLFERNAAAFSRRGLDAIVVTAAGCGAALREPPPGFPRDLGVPVRDVCELLDEVGVIAPARPLRVRVAYHQPCHLVHAQRVGPEAVRRLLSSIPQLCWVPLRDSDRCCGSGGIYNVLEPAMAQAVLEEKLRAILESGAEVVVTGNPGCLLQIRSRLSRPGVEILHPVELLDRAYGGPSGDSKASAPRTGV